MSIDKLFINGSIYTMTAENQKVEAMGVKGDKIAFVGSTKEALEFKGSSDMEVVEFTSKNHSSRIDRFSFRTFMHTAKILRM